MKFWAPVIVRIVSTRFNTGSYGTSGVDFEARYVWSLQSIAPRAGSLAFGFTAFTLLKLLRGKFREVNWLVYVLTALFLARFVYVAP